MLCVCVCFLQAWCVAGNCFSLQREHDIAIKFFQRAIQVCHGYQALILGRRSLVSWGHLTCTEMVLCSGSADAPPSLYPSQVDPGFAYAYTLLGHEFVLTEELDRALACFRNAIRVNNRHYNAWYIDTAPTLTTPTDSTCIKVPPRGPALPDRCSLFRNKQMLRDSKCSGTD